jgi:glutamate/tyrosine decarboxylase-like PLP-dependent enzyme
MQVDYLRMKDNFILSGTRNGVSAAAVVNTLRSLKVSEGSEIIEKIINHNIKMATYMKERLMEVCEEAEIIHDKFYVRFPKKLVN